MDFLNKAFAQFNDFFRSMSPSGRITAGLLLVVAVVSVGYLFQSQVGGGDDYLFGGASIPEATMHKMEEAFGSAGLNGFTIEGGRVKVPHAQRAAYLAKLAEAKALPPSFDEFKDDTGGGPWDPPSTIAQRVKHQRERELSLAINALKNIERSSVLISDPQTQPGLGQPPTRTAAVFASGVGGMPLDEEQRDNICYLVAMANGMKPECVTVTDANGSSTAGRSRSTSAADDDYARAVDKAESYWNSKIRTALSDIPRLTVTSTVMLDHEKQSSTREVKNDPTKTPMKSMDYSRPVYPNAGAVGGAPGLRSQQGGGANQPASLASTGEPGEETKSEFINGLSTKSTETESDGRAIKSVKVAIGIPASYYEKVWLTNNPPKVGEEVKKPDQTALDEIRKTITKDVTAHVATLLPPSPGVSDPSTLVTVTNFPDIKPPEIVGPSLPQRTFTWLTDNWPMLAMVVLVLVSVSMLRSVLRAVPAASSGEFSDLRPDSGQRIEDGRERRTGGGGCRPAAPTHVRQRAIAPR